MVSPAPEADLAAGPGFVRIILCVVAASTLTLTALLALGHARAEKGRGLVALNAAVFALYGIAYALAPSYMMDLITGTAPASSSHTDLRATYGGISLGIAGLLTWCMYRDTRQGLRLVLAVMSGMAAARTLGMLLAGPDAWMTTLLAAEVGMAVLAARALS